MKVLNHSSAPIVPIIGVLAGITLLITVFIWKYFDAKGKIKSVIEITKTLHYKVEDLFKLPE